MATSNYEKYKDVIKVTNAARRAALARLAKEHEYEFREMYLEEARARGLKPTKIERLQKKEDALSAIEEEERAFEKMIGGTTS